VVNRKLDRAVMSRLLWTLVFRLGGEYLSQVSWATTPSPALVGNPKTETGIGASDITEHSARTAKSDIHQCKTNVRFGSEADMARSNCDVRFTPKSGHVQCNSVCPLWAKSGHPSPHSIKSSASESIDAGIVRPSALAVVRLMTSSNLVGCWTGRLAGFSPLST
jgi:hypothetical protein